MAFFIAMIILSPPSIQIPGELDWTTLVMPCANGGYRPEMRTSGSRLAASSWDQLQIPRALFLTNPTLRKGETPKQMQPFLLNVAISVFASLKMQWGKRQGSKRARSSLALSHSASGTSWTTWTVVAAEVRAREGLDLLVLKCRVLQRNCRTTSCCLNFLLYSWLWNRLVWLCWHDNNYSHFH